MESAGSVISTRSIANYPSEGPQILNLNRGRSSSRTWPRFLDLDHQQSASTDWRTIQRLEGRRGIDAIVV